MKILTRPFIRNFRMSRWLFPISILLSIASAQAQDPAEVQKEIRQQAIRLFNEEQFTEATPLFSQLLSLNSKDTLLSYYYGACLAMQQDLSPSAAGYLDIALPGRKIPDDVWYYYARSLFFGGQFSNARDAFKHYLDSGGHDRVKEKEAAVFMVNCDNAQELMKSRKTIAVKDEHEISEKNFFSAYGYPSGKGRVAPAAEQFLLLSDKKQLSDPVMFVSGDNQLIFLAKQVKGTATGKDIYLVRKQANGAWSEPVPASPVINSAADEDYPFMDPNGHTFYFSSKGFNSMGGYDIFRSEFNVLSGEWSSPENLGIPINTTGDDMLFVPSEDGGLATYTTTEKAKTGKLYLRTIDLPKIQDRFVVVHGFYKSLDQQMRRDARVSVVRQSDRAVVATVATDPKTGQYELNLPASQDYFLVVEGGGYVAHIERFSIPEGTDPENIKQSIVMNRSGMDESMQVKNYFTAMGKPALDAAPSEVLSQTVSVSEVDSSRLMPVTINNTRLMVMPPEEITSSKIKSTELAFAQEGSDKLRQPDTSHLEDADSMSSGFALSEPSQSQENDQEESMIEDRSENDTLAGEVSDTSDYVQVAVNISDEDLARLALEDAKDSRAESEDLRYESTTVKQLAREKSETAASFRDEIALLDSSQGARRNELEIKASELEAASHSLQARAALLDSMANDREQSAVFSEREAERLISKKETADASKKNIRNKNRRSESTEAQLDVPFAAQSKTTTEITGRNESVLRTRTADQDSIDALTNNDHPTTTAQSEGSTTSVDEPATTAQSGEGITSIQNEPATKDTVTVQLAKKDTASVAFSSPAAVEHAVNTGRVNGEGADMANAISNPVSNAEVSKTGMDASGKTEVIGADEFDSAERNAVSAEMISGKPVIHPDTGIVITAGVEGEKTRSETETETEIKDVVQSPRVAAEVSSAAKNADTANEQVRDARNTVNGKVPEAAENTPALVNSASSVNDGRNTDSDPGNEIVTRSAVDTEKHSVDPLTTFETYKKDSVVSSLADASRPTGRSIVSDTVSPSVTGKMDVGMKKNDSTRVIAGAVSAGDSTFSGLTVANGAGINSIETGSDPSVVHPVGSVTLPLNPDTISTSTVKSAPSAANDGLVAASSTTTEQVATSTLDADTKVQRAATPGRTEINKPGNKGSVLKGDINLDPKNQDVSSNSDDTQLASKSVSLVQQDSLVSSSTTSTTASASLSLNQSYSGADTGNGEVRLRATPEKNDGREADTRSSSVVPSQQPPILTEVAAADSEAIDNPSVRSAAARNLLRSYQLYVDSAVVVDRNYRSLLDELETMKRGRKKDSLEAVAENLNNTSGDLAEKAANSLAQARQADPEIVSRYLSSIASDPINSSEAALYRKDTVFVAEPLKSTPSVAVVQKENESEDASSAANATGEEKGFSIPVRVTDQSAYANPPRVSTNTKTDNRVEPVVTEKVVAPSTADAVNSPQFASDKNNRRSAGEGNNELSGIAGSDVVSAVTRNSSEKESGKKSMDSQNQFVSEEDASRYEYLTATIDTGRKETIDAFTDAVQLSKQAVEYREKNIALLSESDRSADTLTKVRLLKQADEFREKSEASERAADAKYQEAQALTRKVDSLNRYAVALKSGSDQRDIPIENVVRDKTDSVREAVAPTEQQLSISKEPAYDDRHPIPSDPELPSGLVFKVQIGAFRKPIPDGSFGGLSPVSAESSRPGWIRYCVGMYRTFEPANLVKKEMRRIGYKDAFVAVYYNGKRISLREAYTLITAGNREVKQDYAATVINEMKALATLKILPGNYSNSVDADETAFFDVAATSGDLSPTVVEDSNSLGISYSVQVGVYKSATAPATLAALQPLRAEQINPRLFRFTTGRFTGYQSADSLRKVAIQVGVKDAFVVAYLDGKRVPVPIAARKALRPPSGSTVPALPVSSPSIDANLTVAPGQLESPESDEVLYRVQLGAFRQNVPYEVVESFLKISDKGIDQEQDARGLHIFYAGKFAAYEDAVQAKGDIVAKGVKDAFVVAFRNGKKVSLPAGR